MEYLLMYKYHLQSHSLHLQITTYFQYSLALKPQRK